MHRQCLYGPINSYHSFLWSNLILCLYNVDTFNICMKEFGLEKIFFCNLILCLYNVDTFNICMKEFGLEKIFFCNLILCLYNVDTFNICMKEFGLKDKQKKDIWCVMIL